MTNKKHSIVVPAYDGYSNAKQDLRNLLDSIILGGSDKFCHVLVALDASHRIFEEEFRGAYPDFEFINHLGNRDNFCGNSNRGLRRAIELGTGAFLVNQDAILPGWEHMNLLTERHIVSATTTPEFENLALKTVISGLNIRCDQAFYEPGRPIFMHVKDLPGNKVPGYCFYIPLFVMEEIGLLPAVDLSASFDDDWYTAIALLAGFPVEKAEVFVYHKGSHIDQMQTGQSNTGAYNLNTLHWHGVKFTAKFKIPENVPSSHYIPWILDNYEWTEELKEAIVVR